MCEYCAEDKERANIDDNGEIKIYIDKEMGNNLCIEYYYNGTKINRYIPIVFCPMCSRIINKELLAVMEKKARAATTEVKCTQEFKQPIQPNSLEIDIKKQINDAITNQLKIDPLKLFNPGNISGIMRGGMM